MGKEIKKRKLNKYNRRIRRGQQFWAKKGNKEDLCNYGRRNRLFSLPSKQNVKFCPPFFPLLKHAKRKILHRILKNFFLNTTAAKIYFLNKDLYIFI